MDVAREVAAFVGLSIVHIVKYVPGGQAGFCYWNCDEYIKIHGGNIVYGWQIIGWPPLFVQLFHHGIVRTPSGGHVDPTPASFIGGPEHLFIEDNRIIPPRDYPALIPNRYVCFAGGKEAMEKFESAHNRVVNIKREMNELLRMNGIPFMQSRVMNDHLDLDGMPFLFDALSDANEELERAMIYCRMASGDGDQS